MIYFYIIASAANVTFVSSKTVPWNNIIDEQLVRSIYLNREYG
jgi:hypothetical protein